MKRISHTSRAKDKTLHIETDLGIVNIRVGLTDSDGRPIESIEIVPDNYAGETPVILDGHANNRLIGGGEEKQDIKAVNEDLLKFAKDVLRYVKSGAIATKDDRDFVAEQARAVINKAEGNG